MGRAPQTEGGASRHRSVISEGGGLDCKDAQPTERGKVKIEESRRARVRENGGEEERTHSIGLAL